jgi:hypothetical protein
MKQQNTELKSALDKTMQKNIYFIKRLIRAYYNNKDEYRKSSASDRKTSCDTSAT